MPLARATGMGSTLDCADHSNRVCFLVRSTISWPVIVGLAVAVVIDKNSLCLPFVSLVARVFCSTTKDTKVREAHPRVMVPSQVLTLAGTSLPVNQVEVTFLVSV